VHFNQTLPGPADYNSNYPQTVKGGKIGTSIRLILNKGIDPSPQSYSPTEKTIRRKSPRFSFPSSRRAIKIQESPGPAPILLKEQIRAILKNQKANYGTSSMISKTKKSTLNAKEGPGPNRYNPMKDAILPGKSAYSVMNETRDS
jgi:hypothetical protein